MSEEFYRASETILSATANGLYQGMLVTLVAGLALRWVVRTNAATRHAIWFGVLLFVTALIPVHILLSALARSERPAASSPPAADQSASAPALSSAVDINDGTASKDLTVNDSTPDSEPTQFDDSTAVAAPEPQLEGVISAPEAKSDPVAATVTKSWLSNLPTLLKASVRKLDQAISLPHSVCLGLVCAWIALAGLRAALMVFRLLEVRRIKTRSELPSENLQTLFDRLRESLALQRPVRLKISSAPPTAMLLGFVHPVVLLPDDMELDADSGEVEHILRHELAHVDRRDDWSNLVQQLVQTALFFHPAVWWISPRLSLEREIACDDHVLAASGRPRAYALTLANIATRMNHCRHLLAPGVSHNNSQLQQRITMILNTNRDRSPRLAKTWLGIITTTTAALAALAIVAGPRVVLAQASPEDPTAPKPAAPPTPAVPLVPAAAPTAPVAATVLPDGWSSAESGPRSKAPQIEDDNAAPQPPSAFSQPVMHAPRVAARLSSLAQMDAFAQPGVPPPPAPPSVGVPIKHRTIEERLDRIERLLDEMEARNGSAPRGRTVVGSSSSSGTEVWTQPLAPGGAVAFFSVDAAAKRAAEAAQRAEEQAERAAEAGQRASEEAMRQAQEAMRQAEAKNFARVQQDYYKKLTDAPRVELDALRSARASLESELKNLDRQIQHFEQDQKGSKKEPSANSSGGSSGGGISGGASSGLGGGGGTGGGGYQSNSSNQTPAPSAK